MTLFKTSFSTLRINLIDVLLDKVEPLRNMGPIGALWTARLEMAGIIQRLDEWLQTEASDMFEIAQAKDIRSLNCSF